MKDELEEKIEEWLMWLEENQAEQIEKVNLRGISDVVDLAVLADAKNTRHLQHLSEEAMRFAKSKSWQLLHADGVEGQDWVALDFGDYAIHLFLPEIRVRYDLEKLWEKWREVKSQTEEN